MIKTSAFAAAGLLLLAAPASAVECPQGMASCKVVIVSPQEEAILTQPNGVLATAAEARKVDYSGFVQYFLQKLKDAPAGEAPKAAKVEPPPSPAKSDKPDKK